ncbi:MAG: hypothetical protein DRN25_02220 [Thermoplasmata archaeon]|nr:MAG: hypothetical protein DRN25_02220 [Thermoplasmata archaeon]
MCFQIDEKHTIKFKLNDIFNNNTIEGYINRRPGTLYGSMIIEKVNGKDTYQFIYATPKMSYPFDRKGEWNIPDYDKIEVYEKLDGTNILGYVYRDAEGNKFVTYKTRLRPILGESKFGNFYLLWKEILERYPEIPKEILKSNLNFSFELYGKKNRIFILYKTLLDTRLLFYRERETGSILSPLSYKTDLPIPNIISIYNDDIDIVNEYNQVKLKLEENLKEEEGCITGMEGSVWYFIKNGSATQIKCKPPKIEDIHMRKFRIPYHSIYITIVNSFEDTDSPTLDYIKELLSEEYTEEEIAESESRITKIFKEVIQEKDFQKKILADYESLSKEYGWTIENNKNDVMRWFGKKYPKFMAAKIYNFLAGGMNSRSEKRRFDV